MRKNFIFFLAVLIVECAIILQKDLNACKLCISALDAPPWKHSRPGWMGPWAAWFSGWQPCPLQGVGTRWSLRSFPTKAILRFYDSMTLWFYDSLTGKFSHGVFSPASVLHAQKSVVTWDSREMSEEMVLVHYRGEEVQDLEGKEKSFIEHGKR